MNIARGLSKPQASAVYHYKGPLLVLAGPGSGKTRVITYRVAYLIRNHQIPPENILAVTFTNKAAQEMRDRLYSDELLGETVGMEVWICTFHAACARILRQYGDKIGLNTKFAILDQDAQEELLSQFIRDTQSSISEDHIWLARDFISDAKVRLKDPTEVRESERLNRLNARSEMGDSTLSVNIDDLLEVARRYQEYLKKHETLDFDDLISKTVKLLSSSDEVREELHKKFQFIMVDEYQDINFAQYELIRHLCGPERNIMVVADDDQSIYSWRGSDPTFIDRFKEQYNPRLLQLVDHFRSTKTLLRASQSLIQKNTRIKKGSLITDNDRGQIIYHYKLDNLDEELRLVTWLIKRLVSEKHYSPGQIAIFYRTHKLADKLEQHLIENNIKVQRIRRESLFDDPSMRAVIGYLRLLQWHLEPDVEKALNFPDTVMDELTKLQLERIARKRGISFIDLMRNIESCEDIGPLTKKRVRDFVQLIDGFKIEEDAPASKIVGKLFEVLNSKRSPYHSEDLSNIKSPQHLGDLWQAVSALRGSIQSKQPISVVASYGIDNYCAAGIIIYVLQSYFNIEVTYHFLPLDDNATNAWKRKDSGEDDALYIIIGSLTSLPADITKNAILIGSSDHLAYDASPIANLSAGEGDVVSTTALKLCQRLLTLYETENMEGLVCYDLETIGNNPKTAEILEIAARKIGSTKRQKDATFYQLVKPKKDIPKSSTDIHGITNADVKDKPGIEQALPQFLEFIGDSILVGHNITEFDNKVLSRYIAECMGRPGLTNISYDTLPVAKRLFPLENYKLDALANKFNIPYERLHRADSDAEVTERIFRYLRREEISRNERKSLKEVLPLVAIGILEKNAAMEKENIAFYNAALRYLHYEKGRTSAIELLPISHLSASEEEEAIELLDRMSRESPPSTDDDSAWNMLSAKLHNSVLNFERSGYDKRLDAFLSYTALLTGIDISEESEDKVTMMTAHSAKGTEFPVVIMIGMEQGNFPIIRRDQSESELEEERRLCYVGMTRAKKQLYMTSVRFRTGDIEMTPSQFIWEIQPDLIKTIYANQVRKVLDKKRGSPFVKGARGI